MIDALMNRVRLEAERVNSNRASTRLGLITSYDPANYAVKVALQPDGTETGWMPLGSLMTGNGWGMFAGATAGEQVLVEFQEDGHEAPVCALRIFDNQNRPLEVPSGELWVVHQTGSYIKLTNDGKVLVNSATEIDVGNGANSLIPLVTQAFEALFNAHVHTNGNDGSDTGPTTTLMTSAHLTAVLKAN